MIHFKNSLLVDEAFTQLLRRISEHRIPVSTGLKLMRLYRRLEEERATVMESRNNLLRIYGTEDGEGRIVIPQDEPARLAEFQKEMNELLTTQCEIALEEKLKIPLPLRDKDGREFEVSLRELAMLSELLEFEEAEERPERDAG